MTQACGLTKEDILRNLKEGLESEYRALELCRELVPLLEDEADKKIVAKIAEDEERHIKMNERLAEIVKDHYEPI